MRRLLFIDHLRWTMLAMALACAVSLAAGASAARAVVVDTNPGAVAPVTYPADQGSYAGVALAPGSTTGGLPAVQSTPTCSDPWLSADFVLHGDGLCWHAGGSVMHGNETFAVTWDPTRSYWQTTQYYVQQYLRDVADGRNTLTSQYALTSQYSDGIPDTKDANNPTGRAENASLYGGGCIDHGTQGGSSCVFGNAVGTGLGLNYPQPTSCAAGSICLTDADIQTEVRHMVTNMGLTSRSQPGYTTTLVVLTPHNVVDCLTSGGTLCSVNGTSADKFCSYHSHVNVGGTDVAYVVQPWTANTGCDVPNIPALTPSATTQDVEVDAGVRMVNPLSQGHLAAIVNPDLNGWFANDGSEINDNQGCGPSGYPYDAVTVGTSAQNPYYLKTEFNNGGAIATDPVAGPCLHWAEFNPRFVPPSPIDQGDVVAFDGSVSISSLLIPNAQYHWDFGDHTTAVGASVVHSYAAGGSYTVKLVVTDRGGNTATTSQPVQVLGPDGKPVPANPNPNPTPTPTPGGTGHPLVAHLQLMPQSLKNALKGGITVRLTSNQRADGIASVYISRAAAKRAHISAGRASTVRIGLGTVHVKNGTGTLHLHLAKATVSKLRRLAHVTFTVRLALVAAGNQHRTYAAAGHY